MDIQHIRGCSGVNALYNSPCYLLTYLKLDRRLGLFEFTNHHCHRLHHYVVSLLSLHHCLYSRVNCMYRHKCFGDSHYTELFCATTEGEKKLSCHSGYFCAGPHTSAGHCRARAIGVGYQGFTSPLNLQPNVE